MPDEREPIKFRIELTPEAALSTPERRSELKRIRDAAERILVFDTDVLRRGETDATYDFADAVPIVEQLLLVLSEVLEGAVYRLPLKGLRVTANALEKLSNTFGQVDQLLATSAGHDGTHQQLLVELKNSYDKCLDDIAPWFGFLATRSNNPQEQADQASRLLKSMEKKHKEVEDLLTSAQEAVAQVGSTATAAVFKRQADRCLAGAGWWLAATVLCVIGTGALALHFLDQAASAPADGGIPRSIQVVAARVVAISIASFATVWAARNYRSSRHNQTVNLHRAHALQAFEAFVQGAGDDTETKNALLLQAATAAFGARLSGYESPDATPPMPSAPVSMKLPGLGGG